MTTEGARQNQTTTTASMELTKPWFAKRARPLMLSFLAVGVIVFSTPCAADEPDPPTPPGVGGERGSLVAPSAWFVLNTPVQKQVTVKLYGFYIGNLNVPVAQADVAIRATKFLTITPSYMYYSVPQSGLNKLSPQPGNFTDSYHEQQFRIDGTFGFAIRKVEMSLRAMYVRRFRPAPSDDSNRYRARIGIAYPLAVHGHSLKPFATYEKYYEQNGPRWNRQRLWTGVTLPVNKRLSVQPSYLWERSDGGRDINYLLIGLIVNSSSTLAKGAQ